MSDVTKKVKRTHLLHADKTGVTFCETSTSIVYTDEETKRTENLIAHKSEEIGQKTPWKYPVCHACMMAQAKHGKAIVDAAAAKVAALDAQRHPAPETTE